MYTLLTATLGATILSGTVLGAALGLTGYVLLWLYAPGASQSAVQSIWNTFNEFTLTAVPLFILLGEILVASGLARGVYQAMAPLFARFRGGLLHTNIAVCTVFGAVSGSSMAVAAAVGSVAYPELKSRGYQRAAVVGSLAGGGTLGLLIPPSLSLLIYGAQTDTSIGKLFLAGVLPGLMMAALFMIVIWVLATRDPSIAPPEGRSKSRGEVLRGLVHVLPLVALIVAVLGSLFMGLATPTEAAAVGVAAALVLGFTIGDLTLRGVLHSLQATALTFGIIAVVFLGALVFAQALQLLGVPQRLLETVTAYGISKYAMLAIVVVVYLILGCFFDGLSMMIMTLPIVFPLLTGLGFDPVWLGVVITIMIEVGMLTPPVGMNLFVLSGITNQEVKLTDAAKAATPYWLALLAGVVILTVFPWIATALPDAMIR